MSRQLLRHPAATRVQQVDNLTPVALMGCAVFLTASVVLILFAVFQLGLWLLETLWRFIS